MWLSALVLFLAMLLLTGVLALFGILRFRRMAKAENPAEALAKDVEAIRDGL